MILFESFHIRPLWERAQIPVSYPFSANKPLHTEKQNYVKLHNHKNVRENTVLENKLRFMESSPI